VLIEAEDISRDSVKRSVPAPTENRRAFSLAELMLIVVILGVFAAIAVPRLDYGIVKRYKAEAEARKIVTGLRLARALAISEAATNPKGFDLNMLGGSPYTGFEIENADTKAIVNTCTIDSDISVTGDSAFKFEPLGTMQTGDGQLTVSAEGRSFTITVSGATAVTKCVEN